VLDVSGGLIRRPMYIGEVSYFVSGQGVYGAQSVINVQVVNNSILPRPYRLIIYFYRGQKKVDTKSKTGIMLPHTSSYMTMETYQLTDYAVIQLKPLLRIIPYDEREVTPT